MTDQPSSQRLFANAAGYLAPPHFLPKLMGLARLFAPGLLALLVLLTVCPAIAHDNNQPLLPPASQVFTCNGGVSTSFDIIGAVLKPQSFNRQSLQAMKPSTTAWDYFGGGSSARPSEFTGILLWDLLNDVGVEVNPAVKNDLDRKYIVVTGTDCYQAVFAMGELDPAIAGTDQVTIAYAQKVSGHETSLGANGFARIIVPGDKKGARRVSNIAHIQVISVPAPAS